jgi:uncharacterized protein (DUF58 family)
MGTYLPFLLLLLIIAALFRDDFVFTLVYLVVGAYLVGGVWSRRALAAVTFHRDFIPRAFLGEQVKVGLQISNTSWLPVPWLQLHEGLPVTISGPGSFQRVLNLGPYENARLEYVVDARKRGYYPVGPLFLTSGDILGMANVGIRREGKMDYLTVFPKIVPLTKIEFPSRSPLGTLRHHQPIFEDPTRPFGKRDYIAGDSLRRVDWKSTATTGRLQTKIFEPSIALETHLILNLNSNDYHYRTRIDATELAIVVAASIANWVVQNRQTVGLSVNGEDPFGADGIPQPLPARRGRAHLMRLLEVLARVQMTDCPPVVELVQRERVQLPWGTTLILVTGYVDDQLLDELYQARRAGLNVSVIMVGQVPESRQIIKKASHYGIPVMNIVRERDMNIWKT